MQKEKVTDKEFEALQMFCSGRHKDETISGWLRNSHTWTSDYKPLKDMGLEKFVKCVINGYEIEFDNNYHTKLIVGRNRRNVKVSFNESNEGNTKNSSFPLFLEIGPTYTSLSIKEAKQIIDALDAQLSKLSKIRKDVYPEF